VGTRNYNGGQKSIACSPLALNLRGKNALVCITSGNFSLTTGSILKFFIHHEGHEVLFLRVLRGEIF
jgi:hypothetical protein